MLVGGVVVEDDVDHLAGRHLGLDRVQEAHATGPEVDELIAEERQRSHSYGGRSVFGWEQPPASSVRTDPRVRAVSKRR